MGQHEVTETLKLDSSSNGIYKAIYIAFGILFCLTILSGFILSNIRANADVSANTSANASVNVNAACTLSTTIAPGEEHTATLTGGQYNGNVGTTTVKSICNDAGGYALYAIGYSNNEYGNNKLINSSDSGIYINTGTATSGDTSAWSMKLANVTTTDLHTPTIDSPFNNYANVPTTYTKVAHYPNSTMNPADPSTHDDGSYLTTTYGVYVSPTQITGTYDGKVRYTLVHPSAAIPQDKYYIQDFTLAMCEVLANNQPITVYDKRDEEPYLVQYLKDGNCWMLDNLRLGSNDHETPLSPLDTNIKDSWTLPQGITEGFIGLTEAHINAAYKNTQVDEQYRYGLGSGKIGTYYNYCAASGGTYCYPGDSGVGDAEYDVCPAGWRMPTIGQYRTLRDDYDTTQIATDTDSLQYNLSTPLSGNFSGNRQIDLNSYGIFWSSTCYDGNQMYDFLTFSDGRGTQYNWRDWGRSVRCLAKSSKISDATYMQDVTADMVKNTSIGATAILKDKRDEQEYTVAKLADGKLWMTENLNLAGGTALSAEDTDVDSSYIDSFSTSNNLTKTGNTIVLPASSTSGFNTDGYSYVYNSGNKTNCGSNGQNTPCYSYYSWDAATLGSDRDLPDNTDAPYSMCPKGWQLPSTRGGTDASSDFRKFIIAYGGSSASSTYNDSTNPAGSTFYNKIGPNVTKPNFLLAGIYYSENNSSWLVNVGSAGYYWSSTTLNPNVARFFQFSPKALSATFYNSSRYGQSVRCLFGN